MIDSLVQRRRDSLISLASYFMNEGVQFVRRQVKKLAYNNSSKIINNRILSRSPSSHGMQKRACLCSASILPFGIVSFRESELFTHSPTHSRMYPTLRAHRRSSVLDSVSVVSTRPSMILRMEAISSLSSALDCIDLGRTAAAISRGV